MIKFNSERGNLGWDIIFFFLNLSCELYLRNLCKKKKNVGREDWFNKWKAQTNKSVFTQVLHKPKEFDSDGERTRLSWHVNANICVRQLH